MLGKILIVDQIATNRISLRVKLAAAHYEVRQAGTLAQAVALAGSYLPDLILTTAALPDGDAAQLARKLYKVNLGGKVPVLAIDNAAADDERLRLLSAGVDDVIIKPFNDSFLLARVRSLIRAYASASEWELRDDTTRALGFAEQSTDFTIRPRVALISTDVPDGKTLARGLDDLIDAELLASGPAHAFSEDPTETAPDAFVLLTTPQNRQQMQLLLAMIRSQPATRYAAILVVETESDPAWATQALDMGANDLMPELRTREEMALRLKAMLHRKRLGDQLRATVRTGLEAAVSDPLTGLHNRRYALPHLARVTERAFQSGKTFAVMVADLDHFKRINDTYGHSVGDAVLIEAAERLRENVRGVDTVARLGGEEFLMILPGISLMNARLAAVRLCSVIGDTPFEISGLNEKIEVTVSIGMTVCDPEKLDKTAPLPKPEELVGRADKALYDAKSQGRNRVTLGRPAA
ncbi:MAG: diguanylate cyclase [Pseudomonadota bacterium]